MNIELLRNSSVGFVEFRTELSHESTLAREPERAMGASEKMLMERKWKDEDLRYGDLREVGEVVVREISAVYTN